MLVIDASVAVHLCLSEPGFVELSDEELIAPGLFWSEVPSALHELKWRKTISSDLAEVALERFVEAPIARRTPRGLLRDSWDVAEQLGWAKTYDAEYVALARATGSVLVTLDGRLERGARRLVEVVSPAGL